MAVNASASNPSAALGAMVKAFTQTATSLTWLDLSGNELGCRCRRTISACCGLGNLVPTVHRQSKGAHAGTRGAVGSVASYPCWHIRSSLTHLGLAHNRLLPRGVRAIARALQDWRFGGAETGFGGIDSDSVLHSSTYPGITAHLAWKRATPRRACVSRTQFARALMRWTR